MSDKFKIIDHSDGVTTVELTIDSEKVTKRMQKVPVHDKEETINFFSEYVDAYKSGKKSNSQVDSDLMNKEYNVKKREKVEEVADSEISR